MESCYWVMEWRNMVFKRIFLNIYYGDFYKKYDCVLMVENGSMCDVNYDNK